MNAHSGRRRFLQRALWSGAGLGVGWRGLNAAQPAPAATGAPQPVAGAPAGSDVRIPVPCALSEAQPVPLPEGKRVPFGWPALPVPGDRRGLVLRWSVGGDWEADRFRFTLALDERQEKKIEVSLAESGRVLGVIDMRFGYACQPFELALAPADVRAAAQEGLRLRVLEDAPALWIFGGQRPAGDGQEYLLPHFLAQERRSPWTAAFARLASLASVQPFGWLEGCVLEGLSELERSVPAWRRAAGAALDRHLDLFFPGDAMILETPRSVPSDNQWYSAQAGLMVPALFRRRPAHAIVDHSYAFLLSRELPRRDLRNGADTEGCYTLAYPLALMAVARRDAAGLDRALQQLIARRHQLVRPDRIYQRHWPSSGGHGDGNWSRGIAWYMLGHARLLEVVGPDHNDAARDIAAELKRVAAWVVAFQQDDGLWPCYAHEPETGPETSGSAGISAALLLAHRLGLAPASVQARARRCREGLERYLTPDGFLLGVTQANKGGDALQRGGYRVNSQMGLGLAVQLAALLRDPAVEG